MAVMVRAAGVPARVVLGYTPGTEQDDGSRLITSDDAHAWVEVYFDGLGWVPFDPTPLGVDRSLDLPWSPRVGGAAGTDDDRRHRGADHRAAADHDPRGPGGRAGAHPDRRRATAPVRGARCAIVAGVRAAGPRTSSALPAGAACLAAPAPHRRRAGRARCGTS